MSPVLDREFVLPHLIASRARSAPERPFLADVTGRSLRYGELHEAALRWAAAFSRLGVASGDRVITLFPTGFESYLAWLGCAWLRAIEVPVNTMYRGRMLAYVIRQSGARVIVVAERFLEPLAAVAAELDGVEMVVVPDLSGEPPALGARIVGPSEFPCDASPRAELEGPARWDIACMIYTSGTTGPSKGVLVPWAELYQFATACPPGTLSEHDTCYAVLPTFHVGGKAALYQTAIAGGRVVLREVFSVSEFWNDVRRFGCTTTGLIGMMARLLHAQPPRPDDAENPLGLVQVAPLFPEIEDFEKRFGVRVFTGYGMTEIGAALYMTSDERRDWQSCGRPRPGYELRIVDEHDEEVTPGEVGELVVRTDRPWELNAGYFGMPEKTAEAWRNGWFHTGDGFRRDEHGYFYFVDRLKDAMRRKGENVSSFEVEAYVSEHPDVAEVAAIAAPSPFGLGEDEVKVVVVPRPGSGLDPKALLEFLGPRMPRFMLPRYVELAGELPKTPTMRVRKVELRERAFNARTWDRERGGYLEDPGDGPAAPRVDTRNG